MPQYLVTNTDNFTAPSTFGDDEVYVVTADSAIKAARGALNDFLCPSDTTVVLELGKPLSTIQMFQEGIIEVTPEKQPIKKENTKKTKTTTKKGAK